MGESLERRLKQRGFSSPYQEAMLNILITAEHFNSILESVCQDYGITLTQYNVLRILRGVHPDGHPRYDIIERMLRRAPDVTRLIDRLVTTGLVRRDRSDDDKRLSLTFITIQGIELLEQMWDSVASVEKHVRDRLSQEEALLLSDLCERIYDEI